jgi:hypothetical protein
MSLIQFFIVLFVAFAGSRVILRFRDKAIGYGEFLFWSGIWTLILLVVFQPNIADRAALFFGVQRGTDIMFFSSITLIFYLLFRLYVKLDKLDRDITQLTESSSKEIHILKKS